MADNTVVHIGENSPEQVAYKLMHDVMKAEGYTLTGINDTKRAERKYILDTFAECRYAAIGYRDFGK